MAESLRQKPEINEGTVARYITTEQVPATLIVQVIKIIGPLATVKVLKTDVSWYLEGQILDNVHINLLVPPD